MLTIENLSRRFKNGRQAFHDLDFTVEGGSILGLLGTSGCGKSTLLRVLAGLDSHYDGQVALDGQKLSGLDQRINLVFQEPRLLPWLSVARNVAFGLGPGGFNGGSQNKSRTAGTAPMTPAQSVTDQAAVDQALAQVGLGRFGDHWPKECSGGMAQRVALARALVRTPRVLLLDEPFSALDAFTRLQLQDLLLDIHAASRPTVILVSHDIDEVLYLCDRVLVFRGQPGRLVQDLKIQRDRPRHRGDPGLAGIKEDILELLDLQKHHSTDLDWNI